MGCTPACIREERKLIDRLIENYSPGGTEKAIYRRSFILPAWEEERHPWE